MDGLKTYRPVIEFKTFDERIFSLQIDDAKMAKPILNSFVPIFYDKDNPDNAIIGNKSSYFFIIAKLIFILLVFCFLVFILIKNSFYS
jgi:hypothetical protein